MINKISLVCMVGLAGCLIGCGPKPISVNQSPPIDISGNRYQRIEVQEVVLVVPKKRQGCVDAGGEEFCK